jgi:peptide/nickel transport system substrate-binding protein
MRRLFSAFAVAMALAAPASAETVLRVSLHSDLKIVDPIWTTALISTHYGNMVYDTLFAVDADLKPQPQMVDKWTVSPDKLTWTFTLRDGLEWHDGKPVTGEDCVASIKRWAAKDSMGQKLMSEVSALTAPDAKTIKMVLKEPYGLVLDSLAKPSANMAFMMPKRVADTDPNTQITDYTGSGPFIFKKDEWKPGEKAVFVKNPKYKPRSEPPSGLAGGKVVKIERVEIIEMPDTQQQVNAIIAGEIDLIEQPPHDLIPIMKADKNVQMVDWNPLGQQFVYRMNHLQPPFNNPKIRQAALLCIEQEEYLKATVGEPQYYKVSSAAFISGTPNAFDAPDGLFVKPNYEKAKALLKEAGYDGTPVVLMQSTTLAVLTNTAPVTKSQLEKGGFKVDMQSMDWQTLVTRRTKKDPPDKGGWNLFHTFTVAADILNPISNTYMVAQGDKSWFGWPTDPVIEKLRDSYSKETDPVKAKQLAKAVQDRAIETAQYGWIGQWYGPGAARKNIQGWLKAPVPVMWNVTKA